MIARDIVVKLRSRGFNARIVMDNLVQVIIEGDVYNVWKQSDLTRVRWQSNMSYLDKYLQEIQNET